MLKPDAYLVDRRSEGLTAEADLEVSREFPRAKIPSERVDAENAPEGRSLVN
jgi:hypothetical protein